MPQSKKRDHHHQNIPPPHIAKGKKDHKIIYVSIIFFGLLGMGIAYFITGTVIKGLIIGTVSGALAGLLFGSLIDRTLMK
ncbi:MAG: YtxH domain-containing protein [Ferruginibacter sp.]